MKTLDTSESNTPETGLREAPSQDAYESAASTAHVSLQLLTIDDQLWFRVDWQHTALWSKVLDPVGIILVFPC